MVLGSESREGASEEEVQVVPLDGAERETAIETETEFVCTHVHASVWRSEDTLRCHYAPCKTFMYLFCVWVHVCGDEGLLAGTGLDSLLPSCGLNSGHLTWWQVSLLPFQTGSLIALEHHQV